MRDDVNKLLTAIKETADAEKAEIYARAQRDIAIINEKTEAQIKQFRDEALAKLDAEFRMESESIVGRAKLEIRDRFIEAKNEALRKVFELAGRQIADMYETKTYQEIFRRLVTEVYEKVNCDNVHLKISKTDLKLWESLKKDFPESVRAIPCDGPKGTVIVEIDGGSQSIDNSIETRLEMARGIMKRELAEILFDGETSGEEGK